MNNTPAPEGLFKWLAEVADDPLAFCLGAFPWGKPGTVLEDFLEPLEWQKEIMDKLKRGLISYDRAIQLATASGHGVGKSALVSMLILWAFMTYPDCRGVVTANTETQLKTKTWAELGRWFNLCWFAREHFTLNATSLVSKDPSRERTWRIDMTPWSENNPEAIAGLHNKGKRQIIIFDEASAIADIIWEAVEGATTDAKTQIIWLVFGNPTRTSGRFKECFEGGKHSSMWDCKQLDSRDVPLTNKTRIAEWEKIYGADSDWFRVRIRGVFPRVGERSFFSAEDIDAAMSPARDVYVDKSTPLALGVDVARHGANNSVIFPRKGRDARTLPIYTYNGLSTTELSNKIFECYDKWRPDGIFIDGGGVGGGVVDQCRQKRMFVHEVLFGGKDDISGVLTDTMGERYANKRAAMYGAARAWLKTGALPYSAELRAAMLAITCVEDNPRGEIQLTRKEDILADNPGIELDTLDAFCLTFGGPLAANAFAGGDYPHAPMLEIEHDPYHPDRMLN